MQDREREIPKVQGRTLELKRANVMTSRGLMIGFIIKGTMEQLNDTERDEIFDIVWVHSSANQLEVTKLKKLES